MENTKEVKNVGKLRKLIRNFYPTYIYDRVEDIPYSLIEENNIELLIFDMDNTLIDNKYLYTKDLKKWAKEMKQNGVKLYILTNSLFRKVVQKTAKDLGMKYFYNANKPFLKGYIKIKEETKVEKEHIMMVGDQLFTDVWGGNRFGIKTVLVKPIKKQETFISRIKRPFEKIILKHYQKKKGGM